MFWPPQFSIAIFRCDQLCLRLPGQIRIPRRYHSLCSPGELYHTKHERGQRKKRLVVSAANAANPKLKTALDLVGIPVVNGQYQMFNSGSIKPNFFIGFKLTGQGVRPVSKQS